MNEKHICSVDNCLDKTPLTFNEWLRHLFDKHELYYKIDGYLIRIRHASSENILNEKLSNLS